MCPPTNTQQSYRQNLKRLFYIEYEIAFGKIAENGTLRYEDILKYFAECGHHPSEKEVDDAIAMVTKGMYVL
jgi:Ca2+-binding EF-hand superfamily protein